MTRVLGIHLPSAALSLHQRSTNFQPRDCVTTGSMSRHFARPHAPRCCQDGIITRWDLDRLLRYPVVGQATARIGPRAPHPSRRFFNSTDTTPLRSVSGTSHLTTN